MHNITSPQVTDDSIESEIVAKGLTAPRVTPDQIKALLVRISHSFHVQETSTFCYGFLDGEFLIASGHSACVSKANFNHEIGRKIALEDMLAQANKRLWELEGYALRKKLRGEA